MRTDSLLLIFFLVLLLGILQNSAFEHFLYWKYWWYDVMMHLLGGVIVGALYVWIVQYELPEKRRTYFLRVIPAIGFVILVGVVWEILEYHFGVDQEYAHSARAFDTALDLVMDIIGGLVAYVAFTRMKSLHG